MTHDDRLDAARVKGLVDLRKLLEDFLGPVDRSGNWTCPWHDDRSPSLEVSKRDDDRWKCWPCNIGGDVFDFVMRYENVPFREAVRLVAEWAGLLAPGVGPTVLKFPSGQRPKPAPKPAKVVPADDPEWQATARRLIDEAEARLWSPAGRDGLEWLRWRGLKDETIRVHRLGFVAEPAATPPIACLANARGPRGIYTPRGIVFPWCRAGGEGYIGANVRKLMPGVWKRLPRFDRNGRKFSKCQCFDGSERGHCYPEPEYPRGRGTLLGLGAEGELDGLLAWQEVRDLVYVFSVGQAGCTPHESALAALARCSWLLIAYDLDVAGENSADQWLSTHPHQALTVRVPQLQPDHKDIGDFVQAGGDLRAWLSGLLEKLARRRAGGEPTGPMSRPARHQEVPAVAPAEATSTVPDFPFAGPPDKFSAWVNPDCFGPGAPPHAPKPARWRWHVANWPHARWAAWRRRSGELQPPNPTAAQIEAADYRAFAEIHAAVAAPTS